MTMAACSRRLRQAVTAATILIYATTVLSEPMTCSATQDVEERDPGLQKMVFNLVSQQGEEEQQQVAWIHVPPNVTSLYRHSSATAPNENEAVTPAYKGRVCNFINLSDKELVLYLEKKQGPPVAVRTLDRMSGKGISALQGQTLHFADTAGRLVKMFHITSDSGSLYVHDPYYIQGYPEVTKSYVDLLATELQDLYYQWRRTIEYAQQYTAVTGRPFLSHYGRKPPNHFMWRADYFGQEHVVSTKELHFDRMPSESDLLPVVSNVGSDRELSDSNPRLLSEYRTSSDASEETPTMNMTLKVLSSSPRVFEIANFLSPTEVQHVLDVAARKSLQDSSTGSNLLQSASEPNRRSQNTWIHRDESPVLDSIYRRAADLLRIDEALLRERQSGSVTEPTAAEPLQVVHYAPGHEYKTHVDFAYPRVNDPSQPTRFATLLLYLNEGMKGGETSFPRWLNAEASTDLRIQPQLGKAVLFYSQLPDGNMDDWSQHAALPVVEGEKWLANLWVWDPYMDLTAMQ